MFGGEDIPGSPRVQHKSHVPKIMVIVANARPDPAHNFDGNWHLAHLRHENGPAQLEEEEGGGRVRV